MRQAGNRVVLVGEDEDEVAISPIIELVVAITIIMGQEATRMMIERNQTPTKIIIQEVGDVDVDVVEEGMTNLILSVINVIN